MENFTIAEVAAGIYGEKLYTAAQYKRAEKAMQKYNRGFASRFTMYAAQDEAVAEIIVKSATKTDRVKHMILPQPIVIPIEIHEGKDQPHISFATNLLAYAITMEQAVKKDFQAMLDKKNAKFQKILGMLDNAISINGLIFIAEMRTWECRRMLNALETGRFFQREKEAPYYCSRCGTVHKAQKSFNKCTTCNADATYCTLPFEYI